jgi:hypothetical protein
VRANEAGAPEDEEVHGGRGALWLGLRECGGDATGAWDVEVAA